MTALISGDNTRRNDPGSAFRRAKARLVKKVRDKGRVYGGGISGGGLQTGSGSGGTRSTQPSSSRFNFLRELSRVSEESASRASTSVRSFGSYGSGEIDLESCEGSINSKGGSTGKYDSKGDSKVDIGNPAMGRSTPWIRERNGHGSSASGGSGGLVALSARVRKKKTFSTIAVDSDFSSSEGGGSHDHTHRSTLRTPPLAEGNKTTRASRPTRKKGTGKRDTSRGTKREEYFVKSPGRALISSRRRPAVQADDCSSSGEELQSTFRPSLRARNEAKAGRWQGAAGETDEPFSLQTNEVLKRQTSRGRQVERHSPKRVPKEATLDDVSTPYLFKRSCNTDHVVPFKNVSRVRGHCLSDAVRKQRIQYSFLLERTRRRCTAFSAEWRCSSNC